MKALIFAAGLGTRLRPLTNDKPKALVPVGGKPMLEHVIRHLIGYGFDEIVVNVHHFAQQIIDFLKNNDNFGATIHISDEREELLDTGGGIRKAAPWLAGEEPFLIHNADTLTDLNLADFYDYHLRHRADVTLLTASRATSRYLLCDNEERLCGWTNKKTGEYRPEGFAYNPSLHHELAYGCVQVVSPSVFEPLSTFTDRHKFPIFDFYLSLCHRLKIQCYSPGGYSWFDIGTPEKLARAEAWFESRR